MHTPQIRTVLCALAFASVLAPAAHASVLIDVDKNTQTMTVSVDGTPRYQFSVSTGRAGYGTPNGTYHPLRLERTWFSKEYYNSPMPHSIFFHGGYAIHGSYDIRQLGGPASHGCIRLHPQNAATLFSLVKSEGMGATTITVSGQNPQHPVVARRSAPPRPDGLQTGVDAQAGYRPRYQPYDDRRYENRNDDSYGERASGEGPYDVRRDDSRWSGRGFLPFPPFGPY